jgi:hypothetical protein
MTCRLCQEDRPLKNSHIIPEFFYKLIYNEKHQLPGYERSGELLQGKPLQKGIREKLLCGDCEQQLGRNEKYVREILFGGAEIGLERLQDRLILSSLDYKKIRLFFLSLIWRMSVASEHVVWENVSLGPHEEVVRSMLKSEHTGEPWEYGFVCIIPLFEGQILDDWLLEPDCVRTDQGRFYRLVVGGCLYLFHVSKQRLSRRFSKLLIKKDGSWEILIKNAREIEFIKKEAERIFNIRSNAQ